MLVRNANTTSGGAVGNANSPSLDNNSNDKNRWVTVSWMPHASLSQTSHVAFSVRSVVACLDELVHNPHRRPEDWQVQVTVHGIAGLELAPVPSMTQMAPLTVIREKKNHSHAASTTTISDHEGDEVVIQPSSHRPSLRPPSQHEQWTPSVSNATHRCQWNSLVQIPLRWRDLPRDAYLRFLVVGSHDQALYEASLPLFDAYGKLQTGLTRLRLSSPSKAGTRRTATNPGLPLPPKKTDPSFWQNHDSDTAWKASLILEQLDRFEVGKASSGVAVHPPGGGTDPSTTGTAAASGSMGGSAMGGTTTANAKTFGNVPSVPWLDNLAREYCMETLREAEEKSEHCGLHHDNGSGSADGDATLAAYLIVELPVFDVPVMHEETFYPTPQQGPSGSVTPLDLALYRQKAARVDADVLSDQPSADAKRVATMPMTKSSAGKPTLSVDPPPFHPLEAIPFLDYEDENDSPIDDKYRTLAHDLLRGLVDPALKPDRVQRDKLAAIIASPSHHPTREEKDLLWRFRFSLVDNRRALTKFLLAVDWTVESEVVQAAELLEQWRKRSPIEVTDALKLLGKQVAYQTNLVRAYAIDTLASAPDEELNLYLLQLVQALKFENIQETTATASTSTSTAASTTVTSKKSSLATFLIRRASRNVLLANYLYWYLKVELRDPAHGARYRAIFAELRQALSRTPFAMMQGQIGSDTLSSPLGNRSTYVDVTSEPEFAEGGKGSHSSSITPFNKIVESVSKFGDKLVRGGTDGTADSADTQQKQVAPSIDKDRSVWDILTDQDTFVSGIMDVQKSYESKSKQAAKEVHLRTCLAKEGYDRNPNRLPFPLPCAPEIMVNGVVPEKAKVFRSAVYPALIEFNVDYVVDKNDFGQSYGMSGLRTTPTKQGIGGRTSSGGSPGMIRDLSSYRVLMKTGDDLRQDQLVMMMIKLMDGLLKRASLDLCVTPYSIIATSPTSGIVEFVEQSSPISQILANNNNSILQYFQSCAPQKGAKYGVRPDVISTYVRSVAGGSVITYLLGVGDRHLDNLMITKSGHFFHIDFGFMFGRDPKPLPPAFRLTREMVEGMGGLESTEYRQFCSLACQAFNALRKSAGLVLNLLHLMSDAGIEDLSNNPSADAEGVIAKVEERFRLDLTDEQAERYFLTLINDSLAAIAPRLMDVFHSIAVARR